MARRVTSGVSTGVRVPLRTLHTAPEDANGPSFERRGMSHATSHPAELGWPSVDELRAAGSPPPGRTIGRSRDDRPVDAHVLGRGPLRVSLVGGCHADEPVGPALLRALVAWLAGRSNDHPMLARITWYVVPDANPDGAARNRWWSPDEEVVDLVAYLEGAVREAPGDDVEFGFPRDAGDRDARPENRAIATFLRPGGPFRLHASLHGMAVASGAWFLVEPAWTDRIDPLVSTLTGATAAVGLRLHDVERDGEKGFVRLRPGFCTRPSSRAMRRYFEARGDDEMAGRFRPSSMELVRSLGGDPLTLVSELPLFAIPVYTDGPTRPETDPARAHLEAWRARLAGGESPDVIRREAGEAGLRPVPVRDQMTLQWALVRAGIACVGARRSEASGAR